MVNIFLQSWYRSDDVGFSEIRADYDYSCVGLFFLCFMQCKTWQLALFPQLVLISPHPLTDLLHAVDHSLPFEPVLAKALQGRGVTVQNPPVISVVFYKTELRSSRMQHCALRCVPWWGRFHQAWISQCVPLKFTESQPWSFVSSGPFSESLLVMALWRTTNSICNSIAE